MRVQLFEFEDFPRFPNTLREGGTDYLRYLLKILGFYKPVIPLIAEALKQSGETQIIDLCSGGGGNMEQISLDLAAYTNQRIPIKLSDKYPNVNAFSYLKQKTGGQIDFIEQSVDATAVPANLKGLRTMFSAIHHFPPATVRSILKDATDSRIPIALFDGGDKNIFTFLAMPLLHPFGFLFFTPFFKPFKLSRLLLTYVLPLIPITTIWDGMASILRLYQPEELLQLAKEANDNDYVWKAGKVKNKFGISVSYLIGYPRTE